MDLFGVVTRLGCVVGPDALEVEIVWHYNPCMCYRARPWHAWSARGRGEGETPLDALDDLLRKLSPADAAEDR